MILRTRGGPANRMFRVRLSRRTSCRWDPAALLPGRNPTRARIDWQAAAVIFCLGGKSCGITSLLICFCFLLPLTRITARLAAVQTT